MNGSSDKPIDVLVMAAGLGTRMKSRQAKVLHKLDGRPLIAHVCQAALALQPRGICIIVGHQGELVSKAVVAELGEGNARFVEQAHQRGTGDAVMSARTEIENAK